jgi:hypothetical protein
MVINHGIASREQQLLQGNNNNFEAAVVYADFAWNGRCICCCRSAVADQLATAVD